MLKKIPNILTVGRILIVPFFVLAFYLPGFYGDLTALILFIVASFTDFLDGMLARLLGEESKLGELLDPEVWVIAYLGPGTDSSVLDQSSSYILLRVSLFQIGEACPRAPH